MKHIGQGLMMSALSLVWACDPVPRRELSPEEKQADMMWLYSKFGANYAPLEYKQSLFGFDYTELKSKYLEAAAETANNQEFYNLTHQFVAEFKDAHTSMTLTASGRPGREKVVYLGFTGRREGDNFVVTELAPTINQAETSYPITVGTIISKIDGVPLTQYIKEVSSKYRTTGRDDSDLTALMPRLFTRLSTRGPLPEGQDVTLTVVDGESEVDVIVPWISKDLFTYQNDITAAAKAAQEANVGGAEGSQDDDSAPTSNSYILSDKNDKVPFALIGFDGSPVNFDMGQALRKKLSFTGRLSSMQIVHDVATWTSKVASLKKATAQEKLEAVRTLPEGAVVLNEATIYPAYIFPVEIDEKIIMMGYMLVDTFSPEGNPMDEVKATLQKMQKFGVQDLVIDTINNGGGSLVLLMELAQALRNDVVEMPKIQIGLNEGWIDSLEDGVYAAPSDAEKELNRRLLSELLAYKAQGLRISPKESAYSLNTLVPYYLKPHTELKKNFNLTVLVNEMCASACDIFAGIVQDTKIGTLVGANTMGAGGNVVSYSQSPNANIDVRQTESLLVRSSGGYIENVGVKPDVEMSVSEDAGANYDSVRLKAVEILSEKYKTQTANSSVSMQ